MKLFERNFFFSALGLGLSQILPIILLMILVRTNTLSDVGMFSSMYYVSQFISIIGMYGGRVSQMAESKYDEISLFSTRIFTILIMFIFTFVFSALNNYSVQTSILLYVIMTFRGIEVLSDFYYGILQQQNRLYLVGISMTIRNVIAIIFFMISIIITHSIIISSFFIFSSYLVVFVFFDAKKNGDNLLYRIKFTRNILSIMKKHSVIFLSNFFLILNMNITRYIMTLYSPLEEQATFNLLVQVTSVLLLLSSFIAQPKIFDFLIYEKQRDFKKQYKLVNKIILTILCIGASFAIILFFFGDLFIRVTFKIDSKPFILYLAFASFIASFGGIAYILNSLLVIKKINLVQLFVFLIACAFSSIISIILVQNYLVTGAILAYSISIMFPSLLLYLILVLNYRKTL